MPVDEHGVSTDHKTTHKVGNPTNKLPAKAPKSFERDYFGAFPTDPSAVPSKRWND
jgi:hypothetical protein